jgi:hypothetical protein
MASAAEMKTLRREMTDSEPLVKDLGKFNPDDFNAHEDAFLNLFAQSYGVLKEPLRYIVRSATVPDVFSSNAEQRMYQFPLEGGSFELNNQAIYCKLKAFLIGSLGWAWIEPHDLAENGRNAYLHYNGEGELSKQTAIAKSKLDTLHYHNERSMSFERCTEIMTKCFNTLHKDPDQRYSDRQKVEKLLKAIRCTDPELRQSLTRTFLTTLLALVDTFPSRLLVFTGLPNSNIGRAGTGNVAYLRSTLDRLPAAEAEANLETALGDAVADEVTADGDVADVHTKIMSLTGSMFRIQITVSLYKSGKR